MKLMSFEVAGRRSFGAVAGRGVVDLGRRLGASCADLRALLAMDGLGRAADLAAGASADYALDEVVFLPPVPAPDKIVCVGVNYADRNTEYTNLEVPKYPNIFLRTPGSLVGHRQAIVRPPESPQLDYEGECAIIIGQGGRRIAPERAARHVAGLTCLNEGTIRDWTRHGTFNVTQGKNFERSGAIGPWLVTTDESPAFDALRVMTRVNGEVRQDDTTAHLVFSFAALIAYISTWTELKPGDVIATGTPIGAGARFKPPRWLVPGDVVEVEVSGVGTLSNTIADEAVTR
ncbi:MAG TPA: fumarylacetoacetate hydrolase family protein [Stellaceae bacterium]|nr:fumarylacetoacetate hydrolase family protein [Stellaceae bacterium]